jgi:hypothetical protein
MAEQLGGVLDGAAKLEQAPSRTAAAPA